MKKQIKKHRKLYISEVADNNYPIKKASVKRPKHLYKIVEFITAVILSAILYTVSFIYNIFQFRRGSVFKTLYLAIVEIYKVVMDLFEKLAIILDILGNIILSNLITDILLINKEDKGWFGKAGITISSSLGKALNDKNLNEKGIKFAKILDKPFEYNHCKNAYDWQIMKDEFNEQRKRIVANG